MFGEGAAFGIFQFESSGMRELLRKAKPERLDDLIALNALYRPGPLKSGMVDDWVARKQGKTEVKYELPQLEPILSDTYGVIAYQEQVMRIAQALAGFTLGQADVLRKAMGKKDPKVMAKQREAFMEGVARQGHQREEGDQDLRADGVLRRVRLQQVALDGLRVPGVSDGVPQGELPVALCGGAADDRSAEHRQARDVPGREPRSRHPGAAARHQREPAALLGGARGTGVRFGLTAIKGLGEGAINAILEARTRTGWPDSVAARAVRELDLRIANKRVFEALVKAGRLRFARQPQAASPAAAERDPRPALRRDRRGVRARQPSPAEQGSRVRSISFGGGDDGLGSDDRPASGRPAVVRDRAAQLTRRRRSGSTGRAIRSIATRTTCASTERRRLPTWCPSGKQPS